MKIVYLHQYYRTPEQSGGTRSWELSRRLAAQGHEVHLVTSDTECAIDAPPWRTTEEAGVTVHWAAVPYSNVMSLRQRARAFGDFARRAALRAAKLPQDLVFASSTPLTIALPGAYSARRNRVPMVFEVRDLWPELPIALGGLRSLPARAVAWQLEAWAYGRSAQIVALSPDMATSITGRFPGKPVTVIPNACDIELFAGADDAGKALRSELDWLGDQPLILYAGTIGRANDTAYLARMAASLTDIAPDVQVAVIGSGGQQEALRARAERLNVLGRNFHLLPPVPKAEIPAWLGACDLAISTLGPDPALRSSSPNKIFDAFAAGRPVAMNYQGWLADLVRETGAGVVLPAGAPAEGAREVASLLADPARVAAARGAAKRLAEHDFNRDRLFTQFEQVLLSTVGR